MGPFRAASRAARLLLRVQGMTAGKRLDTLAMACPACGHTQVPPLAGSTLTIAWYACECGHFWSARVRDGRPVAAAILHPAHQLPPH